MASGHLKANEQKLLKSLFQASSALASMMYSELYMYLELECN